MRGSRSAHGMELQRNRKRAMSPTYQAKLQREAEERKAAVRRAAKDRENERRRQVRAATRPAPVPKPAPVKRVRTRKCNDPTHPWNARQSRCDACRRRDTLNKEGDRGPVECTVDYDEWCKATGYDPVTRTYSNQPQHIEPAWVQTVDEGGFSYPEELTHV